jgi:hypothetical protein
VHLKGGCLGGNFDQREIYCFETGKCVIKENKLKIRKVGFGR